MTYTTNLAKTIADRSNKLLDRIADHYLGIDNKVLDLYDITQEIGFIHKMADMIVLEEINKMGDNAP